MTGAGIPTSWRDWAIPGILLVWGQIESWIPGTTNGSISGPATFFAIQTLACCAVLVWRRRQPLAVVSVLGAFLIAPGLWGWYGPFGSQVVAVAVAIFAGARYGRRPWAYLVIPISAVIVVLALVEPGQPLGDSLLWSLNILWIFAIGAAFRHERLLRDQLASTAESASRAALAEERLQVAREVHDVLSHSLSVMIIQAEVADAFLDTDGPRARRAVEEIAATGRTALGDTRRIVGVLREPGDRQVAPAYLLADVPALIRRMRDAGLPIAVDVPEDVPPLSEDVSATAYRVVQESLTNVLRHAGKVATDVRLSHDREHLHIEVVDHGLAKSEPSTTPPMGHGLAGMRERVLAFGGALSCGPSADGGFRVRADLPLVPRP